MMLMLICYKDVDTKILLHKTLEIFCLFRIFMLCSMDHHRPQNSMLETLNIHMNLLCLNR